jgi:hypothetical protein
VHEGDEDHGREEAERDPEAGEVLRVEPGRRAEDRRREREHGEPAAEKEPEDERAEARRIEAEAADPRREGTVGRGHRLGRRIRPRR